MSELYPFDSRWLGNRSGRCWRQALPPGRIALLLLLEGSLELGSPLPLRSNHLLWLNTEIGLPKRLEPIGPGSYEALLLLYPVAWVRQTLSQLGREIAPDLRRLLLNSTPSTSPVTRPLEAEDRNWARGFMAPTLCSAARQLLEGSRMSEFFFRKVLTEACGEELFCTRTRRMALERVAKVREALMANLEEPPDLSTLAKMCGCHPQYLSRTFSETAGMPISLYLRRLRIERAANLLASGQMNASEASLEVGYRSLSHFSHAFREEKGSSPSEWLRLHVETHPSTSTTTANMRQLCT